MTWRPWRSVQVSWVLRGPLICQVGVTSLSGDDGGTATGGTGACRSRTKTDVAAADVLPAGAGAPSEKVNVPSGGGVGPAVHGEAQATRALGAGPPRAVDRPS